MTKEDPELASSNEDQCVTCSVSRAVMMVYPCNHVALCRLCFVKMIKHVSFASDANEYFTIYMRILLLHHALNWSIGAPIKLVNEV